MGFMAELKDKAEGFGDRAQECFGAPRDKTEDVIENVKDRFDSDDSAGLDAADAGISTESVSRAMAEGIRAAGTTESAASVDEALGSQEAADDIEAGSAPTSSS
jgi:hypothetical protein